jgi:hypothetical protein
VKRDVMRPNDVMKLTQLLFMLSCVFTVFVCGGQSNDRQLVCSGEYSNSAWYKYKRHASTGLTQAIIHDGRPIFLKFSDSSDFSVTQDLGKLHPGIFTSQNQFQIYGRLCSNTRKTKSGENRPSVEEYQLFELKNWRIVTPFSFIEVSKEGPEGIAKKVIVEKLSSKHFLSKTNKPVGSYEKPTK